MRMRRRGRLHLRNKIVEHLNRWQQLGCLVKPHSAGMVSKTGKERFLGRLISGVAKDGRAILILPILSRKTKIPFNLCRLMMQYDGRGAIVGTAEHIGDAWDIVYADPKQYKRKAKTYLYRFWFEKYSKGKKDDSE